LQVEQLAVVASPGECARHRVSKLWIHDLQADPPSVIQVLGNFSWNIYQLSVYVKPRENSDDGWFPDVSGKSIDLRADDLDISDMWMLGYGGRRTTRL
jgi:hypothetical protein